jgi:uroporphyrinogen-III synthase
LQLDQFQHIIFISTNAVAFGMEWINQYWPQLPLGMHWHGIGKKTIAALAQAGAPVIESALADNGPMDSEALLADLQLCNLTQQKILIVRGVGGRETLREQLQQRGAKVSYIECYQRQRVDRPVGEIAELIRQHGINSICVNSGESLQHLCYLVGPETLPAIKKLLLVTPGERVAEIARQLQFEQIAVASNASDPYMLAALLESYAGAH